MSKKAFAQGLKPFPLDQYRLEQHYGVHRPDLSELARTNPGVKPHEAKGVRILRLKTTNPKAEDRKRLLRALERAYKTARHAKTDV